jgi:hypothetical protein
MKMFSVYDSKASAFSKPFFIETKGLAVRSFEQTVNDEQSALSRFPADFTLFELGDWDPSSGQIAMHKAPVSLGLAVEFKRLAEQAAELKSRATALEAKLWGGPV